MKTRTFILLIFATCLLGCKSSHERTIKEQLIGEWEIIEEKNSDIVPPPPTIRPILPYGMTFFNDSIELHLGFFKEEKDSLTGQTTEIYLGNNTAYKIKKADIIIKNPITEEWEVKWKFIERKTDTLILAVDDTTFLRFKRLHYNLDPVPDFDQIIYSSSVCYGSCSAINISIDKTGEIIFLGEGYVESIGLFKAKANNKTTKHIFDKFRKASSIGLLDKYDAYTFDDQTITTTFIKDGKIVKTIHDDGIAGPSELTWAYIPIAYLYSRVQLDTLSSDKPFFPKLHYSSFEKDELILSLEKSESFYLWTELLKAKPSDKVFKPKYKFSLAGFYPYFGPDPNEVRKHKHEISSITTDGQYFKFEIKDSEPITYDLGYNFVDRNFQPEDFRKPKAWDK